MPVAVVEFIWFVLTLNRADIKVTADWDSATRKLRVRVGFMAMLKERKSMKISSYALRKKLLQQNILVKQVAEAVGIRNGKQAWRDLTGKSLADYVNQIPPISAAHSTRLSTAPSRA